MSVKSEIQRIKNNISAAYVAAEAKGATMPLTENSANLADTVASIPEAVQPTLITKEITENGTYTAEDDGADGYSEVTIDIPDQSKDALNSLIDRSITTITSEVTLIGDRAFNNCTALTEANFPKATSIVNYSFSGCTALTEANFPEVTYIGYSAFSGCTALTEANFPKVTSIASRAFNNCTAIKYFDMSEVDRIPRISNDTFYATTCIFLFRDQTQLNEYASATNWSALADRFQIKEVTP